MNFTTDEAAILLNALEDRMYKCAFRATDPDYDSKYWSKAREATEALYNKIESGQVSTDE